MSTKKALRYSWSGLAAAGGLLAALAIRYGVHGSHWWPLLAGLSAAAWAGCWLSVYLPYRAEQMKLRRKRQIMLDMMAELNEMLR